AKAAEENAEAIADDEVARPKESGAKEEYWTVRRIEKAAERGFETWYEGDRWRLKLSLSGSDIGSSDVAMERFCAWLRRRLADFKDTHGAKVLRQCQGEVDFSYTGLSDHGLWLLLDCLSQFEVQAAFIKLTQNRITKDGIQSLCEFIKNNKRAGQIYELHLADNQINDDGALELIQTMKELKHRYPPKREVLGKNGLQLVPVWLRLARNKIKAATLLKSLSATDSRTQCPLVQHDLDQERNAMWNEHSWGWDEYEERDEETGRLGRSGRRYRGDQE
ncbi:Hypothetical protein SCF082_LOCUS36457, partial [Durusdinium trenchii]